MSEENKSTNEDASEQRFNTVEGITMIFRLMLSIDGEVSDEEATKLVERVTPYVEYVGEDLESVVANALEIFNSNTFKENLELAINFAAVFRERSSHQICINIGVDLSHLAWADDELHDNETKYYNDIIEALGVSPDEVNAAMAIENANATEDDQVEESTNEEASAEQETEDQYPFLPSSWGVEHVVVVPLRDSMLADAKVDQMEHNNLAHFFENFGQIGIDCYEVWDEVDDQLQKFEKLEKIAIAIKTSAAKYLKDNMDDEHLSKLIWYMAEMVCNDDVIQYREYVILRFYLDQWYSQAIDDYMGKFKNAGMTIITSPDNG